ncbi:MAG: MerR family transcriptional regulator [Candidatus Lokiarchaeota archaeon]|nr:MerR family transcriptional regulator [Candidatus Lokiarchaeota archaeon]
MMNGKYLRVEVAAAILGVCTKTLRRWDKSGILKPAFRTQEIIADTPET